MDLKDIKTRKFKAIIFDIDGVLIDSFEVNLSLFRNILKQAGYKNGLSKQKYKEFFFRTALDTFKAITQGKPQEIERLMELLHNYPRSNSDYPIIPNSVKVIKQLAKKYKLALVTARMEIGVDHYLDLTKTKKDFKVVVHFGHYKNPKPHPEPLLVACQRLKIQPAEAIYIGDALSDIQSAKSAGMKVILFPKRNIKGADGYAKEFSEIPKIIEHLAKQ